MSKFMDNLPGWMLLASSILFVGANIILLWRAYHGQG